MSLHRRLATALALCAAAAGGVQAQTSAPAGDDDGRIRAQLVSRNAVTVSSELAGRIAVLSLREGDAFGAGQTLVGLDCALYQSALRKAEAGVEAAAALVQSNQRLVELNSIGAFEAEQARAQLKQAQAEATTARTIVGRCRIAAPFAGRVAKRHAAAHQYVAPGTPLLDIVETAQLEVQMIVPSRWLAWLKPGAAFAVDVEELGRRFPAKVKRLGAQIDPVSQSISVVGVIEGRQPALLPGMSGWALFPPRP